MAVSARQALVILVSFLAGVFAHVLYQRWNPTVSERLQPAAKLSPRAEAQSYPVRFVPLSGKSAAGEEAKNLERIVARDVEKIRALTGQQARIYGRVFRVGHAAKSNTYFLNFGPSRGSLTAVIFDASVELFEKEQQPPKHFENREVEIVGFVKDHPQYGLEIILEHPRQIKIVN